MKIIYITNARIPTEKAHGYQIFKMCEEFSNQGAEVELWIPTRDNHIKENNFSFYGVKNNFKIREIKSFDFYIYHKYLGKLSFWLQGSWFVLKLLFIRVDKDVIIYTRNPEIGWIFNLKRYKVIVEVHNWPSKDRLYRFLIKRSNKIITITNGLKKLFLKNSWPENNILVAPDGVDLKKFDIKIDKIQAKEKLNLPTNKKIILYCGSLYLYGWKGVDIFLAAAGTLPEDYLAILVGGESNETAKIKNKYGGNNLLLVGRKRHEEIPYYLKSADVLVLPNKSGDKISEQYTSPLKLFEYMASGVPIIASALPSLKEILNGKNSFLFKPDDSESLAQGIKKLIQDNNFSQQIARQALLDVKNYTWEKRTRNIIEFIKFL
ncbi:MAG: Glycosyl transferase group 1 [Parcubacteria group bacterium GW2011_GWC2_42_12]|nr:MAG: Glycosyl transferase group 1 [Parcubacteria group bacterium GW2011_GWC2_42_12]